MDYLKDMNDLRLKPRLLRALTGDVLPDDAKRPSPTPSQLSSALHLIKTHGLLSETLCEQAEGKLVDAWKSAVDEWVERVLKLASSDMADKCWAGVSLLGVTCEECSPDRFVASYSDWFHRLLSNIQPLSESQFVKVAACASFSGIFTRLSTFSKVKKDATSLAIKLVQPVLNLLTEDATESITVEAVNLITTLIVHFPSALHRHYDKVEMVIVSRMMSAKYSMGLSKRLAYCFALLPKTKGNQDTWSLMMERILITINNNLNDAFQGLEDGHKSSDIIKSLIPAGKELPPSFEGSETTKEIFGDTEKRFREILIPRISTLLQCCCSMLTTPCPVQVYVPIYPLLKVVERLLLMNGSKHDSVLSFTTSLHQRIICSELPTLHLNALDLLSAIIKGLRSQLLPHAANIVGFVSRYIKNAAVPANRVKLYSIMKEMLLSIGSGMVPYLGDLLLNIAIIDIDSYIYGNSGAESQVCGSASECTMKVGNGDSLANTHRKRKHSDRSSSQNGAEIIQKPICRKPQAPLSVQIAAVEALGALLSVGGSLKSESWRSSLDLLLIGVITNAYDATYEEFFLVEEASVIRRDLQLAAMQLLLASLLSATCVRPRYLSRGLELFRRGKLETGTKLAEFCGHALLSLEVLIHPRVLSLSNISEETTPDKFGDFNNVGLFGGIGNQRPEAAPFTRGFLHETTSNKFGGPGVPSSDEMHNHRPDVSPISSGYINTTNNLTLDVSGETNVLRNRQEESRHASLQGGTVSEATVVDNQQVSFPITNVEHQEHMIVDGINTGPDEQAETSNQGTDVIMASVGMVNPTGMLEKPSLLNGNNEGIPVVSDATEPTTEDTINHADALSSRIDILRKRLAAEAQMGRNADYDSDEPSLDSIPDIVDEEPESD